MIGVYFEFGYFFDYPYDCAISSADDCSDLPFLSFLDFVGYFLDFVQRVVFFFLVEEVD